MCLGSIVRLTAVSDADGVRVGRLETGATVPLSLVPGAEAGDCLLLHLGIPVEILDPDAARSARALRASAASAEAGA